ncbi:MAG: GntR family transcriptional regulator [Pseudomonadota bacterium]
MTGKTEVDYLGLRSIKADRRRLADEVYTQLMDAIIGGEIGPDDRLVQERLAAEMEISRTPVREALLRLEQEGMLVNSPRGGFVLYRMTEGEIRELYQARAAVESQAARILAAQRDGFKNRELRATIEREENISNPSVAAYFEANRTIHRRFVELVENRYLLEMFDNIWNRGTAFQLFAAIEKVDLSKSLGDHMALVDAVETGDLTTALDAFIHHIQDGFDLQMEAFSGGE